jgi:hypothetical protein
MRSLRYLHLTKKCGRVVRNKNMASSNPSTLSPLEKIIASSLGVNTVGSITKTHQNKIAKIL